MQLRSIQWMMCSKVLSHFVDIFESKVCLSLSESENTVNSHWKSFIATFLGLKSSVNQDVDDI